MRFVLDMNLAPRWCDEFARRGHDAVHWGDVGSPGAPDAEVMAWTRAHDRILFTHDLDFGTLLALTYAEGPSVMQARVSAPVPEEIGAAVFEAIERFAAELEAGALVTVDVARARVRMLPIRPG